MGYIKAQNVLPEEVIKLIQEYVDGECLYIPRKDGNEKSWGEKTGIRNSLQKRNTEIFYQYVSGITMVELARQYYLTEKSISRIISKQKFSCS